MKCLDENVCISRDRKYFTNDAWKLVGNVIETMKKSKYGCVQVATWAWVIVRAWCVKVAWTGFTYDALVRKSHQINLQS